MLDSELALLFIHVPEIIPTYLMVLAATDDEPGLAVLLSELAEFVLTIARQQTGSTGLLRRCFAGVEALAAHSAGNEDLIAGAFLGFFSQEDLGLLRHQFGPVTLQLLADLDGFGAEEPAH
jgi:hypothetical protein